MDDQPAADPGTVNRWGVPLYVRPCTRAASSDTGLAGAGLARGGPWEAAVVAGGPHVRPRVRAEGAALVGWSKD